MKNERLAVRSNLGRVTGRGRRAGLLDAFRLFYNFSKFMVAYVEMPPFGAGIQDGRVAGRDDGDRLVGKGLGSGHGLIVLGAHLGQWDLALLELARHGRPVTVVMRREEGDAARFAASVRRAAGLRVVYAAESPWMMVTLLGALRRGEIVAFQGDRSFGGRAAPVDLFGAPVELPTGPVELALASGAPILPGVAVFEGHRRYRLVFGDLLEMEGSPKDEGRVSGGLQSVSRALESLIRAYPYQWFDFYDVWETEADAKSRRAA